MPDPWYAPGLSFSCTQCGNCCSGPPGYVWFDGEEANAMASFLKLDLQAFLRNFAHTVNGNWTLNEVSRPGMKGQYDCVFLRRDETTGKAGCSIYHVRPRQCRTWPFWPELLSGENAWRRASQKCPGMNTGKFYPVEQIRIIRDGDAPL
jgi:Fe-S-cluster containining protein